MSTCGQRGNNQITHCVEPEGHDGCHTYAPFAGPDPKLSDELEWVKTLLVQSCPDWRAGDMFNPRPSCCPFHQGASVVHEAQKVLRSMDR